MKQKTRKAVSKRFSISKGGKVMRRKGGQDHFNSRESGKVTRNKRRDEEMSSSYEKTIKTFIANF